VVQGRGRAEGDYEGGEVGGDEHSRRAHDLLPYPPPAPLHLHVPVLGQTLCHHLLLVLCAATGRGGCRRRLLELELYVDRIRELRAELEFERWMRRKAEALVMELVEERRRGEAECRALREEAAAACAKAEEAEEERRMLCVAELWHEERVQMKLVDARAAMEKLREFHDAVASSTPSLAAGAAVAPSASRGRAGVSSTGSRARARLGTAPARRVRLPPFG
jgi:hypothetical protein